MYKYYIFLLLYLSSCTNKEFKNKCVDTGNLLIHEKIYSPDSSAFFIRYSLDEGAFGSCCNQMSVLKLTDSLCYINEYNLPPSFDNFEWVSNEIIGVDIQMISNLQASTVRESKVEYVNGFKLKKRYFNKIKSTDQRIEVLRVPNSTNTLDLISYEYKSRPYLEDSLLHISVIPKDSKVPLYGNLYIIRERLYGKIQKIEWIDEKTIRLIINSGPFTYGQIKYSKIDEPYMYASAVQDIKVIIEYKNKVANTR